MWLRKILYSNFIKSTYSKIWKFYLNYIGVEGCENIKVYGFPIIRILNGGKIHIGKNVTLHSKKSSYFALMSSPTKLFVENGGEIIIGDNSRINGSTLHARKKIKIGKNVLIAANTSIIDSNGHALNAKNRFLSDKPKVIVIEDNVWVALNCLILKGVRIGKNSVISAFTVVDKNIPANKIYKNKKLSDLKK